MTRFTSPKAVRAAITALTGLALATPAVAHSAGGPAGAYGHLPAAHIMSDAAQRTSHDPLAPAFGTSDAAQRTSTGEAAGWPAYYQRVPTVDGARLTPLTLSSASLIPKQAPRAVPVAAKPAGDGFDVSSAVIGAGAAALLLCAGGALAITPKRRVVGQV